MNPSTSPADLSPKRVLIAGDWHGDTKRMRAAVHAASVYSCDAILHVGDLGILWPDESPKTFDLPLVEELEKNGNIPFIFIDGNHDNHAALRNAYDPDGHGFVEVLPGIWWASRAVRWNWSGVTFAGLGGAYSVDREHRRDGESIWVEVEEVRPDDIAALGSVSGGAAPVDVLLTHDVPFGVPAKSTMTLDRWIEDAAEVSRHLLREAVENVLPKLVFSGHWHQRLSHDLIIEPDRENRFEDVRVRCEVLDMNGSKHNAVLLDLEKLGLENHGITELADVDPDWHKWTRRSEKNHLRKLANDRFIELVDRFIAEGMSDSDARLTASRSLAGE